MRPLLVVGDEPAVGHRADLSQRFKEIGIEHLGAIAAVEALDEGVLIRLARLDVVNPDFRFGCGTVSADQSPRLDFRGSDARNPATAGDTLWVNYSARRFSSRSMAF